MDATCSQRVHCSKSEKETSEELHKAKNGRIIDFFILLVVIFKDVDIPKSMLIKGIYTSNFFKVFFRVQNVFTVSSAIINII